MALTQIEVKNWKKVAREYLDKAGIVLTTREQDTIEITDLGLGEYEQTGVALVVYFNDEKYCAKEIVLMPRQTVPQHMHPPIPGFNYIGKQETIRCRWGVVYMYVEGEETKNPKATPQRALYRMERNCSQTRRTVYDSTFNLALVSGWC